MKVISKADISEWSYKHICQNCDSELLVESSDLKYHYYEGDMREPGYSTYECNCSVCDEKFCVPFNNIPKLVQLEAKKRATSTGGSYFDR